MIRTITFTEQEVMAMQALLASPSAYSRYDRTLWTGITTKLKDAPRQNWEKR
jgi:hypothetical protein